MRAFATGTIESLGIGCAKGFYVMNATNPFQIPSCLQASLQQRRRERFKRSVIVVVAGTTVLLAVLLILGCNSEHARAASTMTTPGAVMTVAPDTSVTDSITGHSSAPAQASPAPSPIVAPLVASVVSKEGAIAAAGRPATIYVVKPADTLSRIAKVHGTTVTALKMANGLATDRIAIGMKLKLPEA